MSDSATPLLCPKCGSNIGATVETKRVVTFQPDDDGYGPALYTKTPREYWENPKYCDSSECDDLSCGDTDCENDHNYDPQKNKELLEDPSVKLQFTYDWDYLEEESEEVIRLTRLYCTHYSCDWSKTMEGSSRIEMTS